MQANQIVILSANTGMAPGDTLTLDRSEEAVNRTTYEIAGEHTLAARSIVQLYRTYPKRSGASRGSAKCTIKFTKDISVANADGSGELVLPLIGEVSFSMPVGVEASALATLRKRLTMLLIGLPDENVPDVTVASKLCESLSI